MRTSCSSLYRPRRFPLPLWAVCWRPGVCQEDCGLHLATLQTPDWLPPRLLSPGFPLCESPTAAQRAGPMTCIPQALLLPLSLRDIPVTMTNHDHDQAGEWKETPTVSLPLAQFACTIFNDRAPAEEDRELGKASPPRWTEGLSPQ